MEAPEAATALGRRDRALLEFLYATGAQVAETVGVDLADLELEERTALVTGKGSSSAWCRWERLRWPPSTPTCRTS